MTTPITIIRATTEHLAVVVQLFDCYRRFYGQDSDTDGAEAFLAERLQRADSVILLALRKNSPVGFVQLYPSFSSVAMKRVWILNDLFVAELARQEGVGLALMQEAQRFSKETNAVRLILATGANNLKAQALYEKLGWYRDDTFLHFRYDL